MIKKLINIFPYLLFAFFVYIPINLSQYDMWDGTVIEYASRIKNLSSIKRWFFDSGWYLQYYQILLYYKTATILNIKFKIINDFSILILGFILIKEVKYISKTILNLSKSGRNITVILISIYPAWSLLLSSVLTFYFLCFVLGIMSIRLLHSNKIINILLSAVLILLSYNFNSLLFFLPALSYLYDINLKPNKYFIFPSTKTILIFAVAVFYYIYFKIIHPPSGIYINYNVIKFDDNSIKLIIKSFLGFFTFLSIPLISLFLFKSFTFKLIKQLLFVLILFISASFPYILVGRFVQIFSYHEWDYRHVFLLSISLTLYLGIIFDNKNNIRFSFLFNKYIILLIFTFLFLSSTFTKINRQKFELDLISVLKANNFNQQNSLIQITGDGIPLPNFRIYESNYLIYNGFNIDNNWVNISKIYNPSFNVPLEFFKSEDVRLGYILNTNVYPKNKLHIKFIAKGYTKNYDIIKNVLNINNNRTIFIIK